MVPILFKSVILNIVIITKITEYEYIYIYSKSVNPASYVNYITYVNMIILSCLNDVERDYCFYNILQYKYRIIKKDGRDLKPL